MSCRSHYRAAGRFSGGVIGFMPRLSSGQGDRLRAEILWGDGDPRVNEVTGVRESTTRRLVRQYVEGEVRERGPRNIPEEGPGGIQRVHAVLLLYSRGFPTELIHDVLWCSCSEVEEHLNELREHFPDAEAAKVFLENGYRSEIQPECQLKHGSVRCSVATEFLKVSAGARDALDMLDYWTSRWLDEHPSSGSIDPSA